MLPVYWVEKAKQSRKRDEALSAIRGQALGGYAIMCGLFVD